MRRLGLAWRVTLFVLASLVALQIVVAGLYFQQRGRAMQDGVRLPLPDQIAALVTLLDHAPPTERGLLLRAVNGYGLDVTIQPDPPEPTSSRRLAWVEDRLRHYLGQDDKRFVLVTIARPLNAPVGWPSRFVEFFSGHVRAVVALEDGDYLVAEAGDQLMSRLFGIPTGFWAGIIGFAVAALAVIVVLRETRPLSQLAKSVDRFGTALDPTAIPERGAREVRSLIRAFNVMQARIAASVATRTFMIGAISHDLKTYLTRLRLRIESLPDIEMRSRAARDIEDMQTLLDDSLNFAHDTFVGAPREPVDLANLLERECAARRDAGMKVALELLPGSVIVHGSESALARAIGNLLDNAIGYGDEAEVTLRSGGGRATILVDDHGPGIPETEREAIFEPFRRLEASRNRERGGAGLGLAIVRQVVESHGGSISVGDRPGGGARFTLALPLASG